MTLGLASKKNTELIPDGSSGGSSASSSGGGSTEDSFVPGGSPQIFGFTSD